MTDSCSSSGSTYALGEYSSRTRHLATALDDDYYDAGGDGATTTLDGGLKAPRCSPALWLLLLLLLLLIALATLLYSPKGQLLQGESAAPLSLSSFLPHTHTLSLSLHTPRLRCCWATARRAQREVRRDTAAPRAREPRAGDDDGGGAARQHTALARDRERASERRGEREREERRGPPSTASAAASRALSLCMHARLCRAGRPRDSRTHERASALHGMQESSAVQWAAVRVR